MSNLAKSLEEVTEEEFRSKQHYYAHGEDSAWIDVYIEEFPVNPSPSVK
jgi:hypothetical protein